MKKVFMVEIEYEEAERNKEAHVLYDIPISIAIENLLDGYVTTENIERDYDFVVTEITE